MFIIYFILHVEVPEIERQVAAIAGKNFIVNVMRDEAADVSLVP